MDRMILTRGHCFGMGTVGRLHVGGFTCVTMERPWADNAVSISCIPPGVYTMRKRPSEVVRRASKGRYAYGWEVTGVPGRTYIMLHPGNTIDDSEGCILPGEEFGGWSVDGKFRWAVTNSKDTFHDLMEILNQKDEWTIEIAYFSPEFP